MPYSRNLLRTLLVITLCLTSNTAQAWSAGGHRVIAMIAWNALKPETRSKLTLILRSHPRLSNEFHVPSGVRSQGAKAVDEWLFTQAAVWPDLIRGNNDFDRPSWHYVNFPIYLSELDERALQNRFDENLRSTLPRNPERARLNGMQSIALSNVKLKKEESNQEKAIALCWLSHVVGDLHQPLHAGTLYSRVSFPDGDRGGNLIPLIPNHTLHNYWDRLLGDGKIHNNVRLRATQIAAQFKDQQPKMIEDLTPAAWAKEGVAICRSSVYSRSILDAVEQNESRAGDELQPLDLSEGYKSTAGKTANKQVAKAGFRLAAMIELALENVKFAKPQKLLKIAGLLPNPVGQDESKEEIVIQNDSDKTISLQGWKLRDRGGNEFELTGSLDSKQSKTFRDADNDMPLNNSGDEVSLVDPQGNVVHTVSYRKEQVTTGKLLSF